MAPAWKLSLNEAITPLRLLVPEPWAARTGILLTNAQIRTARVFACLRGRVLDVGCGTNRLARTWRLLGGEAVGADVHPWPGCDLVLAPGAAFPYPDGFFDTVTFLACLNHIPDRERVAREAARLLSPGGRAIVTMIAPALGRLWHRVAWWDADQRERAHAAGERTGMTRAEVQAVFAPTGLRLGETQRFSWGLVSLYVFEKPAAPPAAPPAGPEPEVSAR